MLHLFCNKKCEYYLQSFIKAMAEGFAAFEIIYSKDNVPYDCCFLEVNSAFEEIIGLKRDDLIGKTILEAIPVVGKKWLDMFKGIDMTKEKYTFETYSVSLNKYFKVSVCTPIQGQIITIFTDITELKKIDEVSKKHQILFDFAQDIVLYVSSSTTKILDANKKAMERYGYTKEELLNLKITDLRHPSTVFDFEEQMKLADANGIIFESLHVTKTGSTFPVEVSSKSVQIGNETIRIHIIRDISERKKIEEKIAHLANYDSLTRIANRNNLMTKLDEALENSMENALKFAVFLYDIDSFKKINDLYGHNAGDEVLRETSRRIKEILPEDIVFGRLGGDEFLLIVPYLLEDKVFKAIDNIFDCLEKPIIWNDQEILVSISIGISFFSAETANKEDLINLADSAMYKAKQQKGNTYEVYAEI